MAEKKDSPQKAALREMMKIPAIPDMERQSASLLRQTLPAPSSMAAQLPPAIISA